MFSREDVSVNGVVYCSVSDDRVRATEPVTCIEENQETCARPVTAHTNMPAGARANAADWAQHDFRRGRLARSTCMEPTCASTVVRAPRRVRRRERPCVPWLHHYARAWLRSQKSKLHGKAWLRGTPYEPPRQGALMQALWHVISSHFDVWISFLVRLTITIINCQKGYILFIVTSKIHVNIDRRDMKYWQHNASHKIWVIFTWSIF